MTSKTAKKSLVFSSTPLGHEYNDFYYIHVTTENWRNQNFCSFRSVIEQWSL